jgi:D-amino peptidase
VKVFILVDMEGISGICLEAHTTGGTAEYEMARRWMTQDVNAAVQGALDGGASEIVVADGHGTNGMYNLVYHDLHEGASYIEGSPRDWYIAQLDGSFDCMLMVGMHAMSGTPRAVLEHTWSGERWHKARLNGRETGEIGLMAAYAGSFGVPVTFVSGDLAAVTEARQFLGESLITACVKEGLSRYAAKLLPPQTSRELIRKGTAQAVRAAGEAKPYIVETPVALEVDYVRNSHVDVIRAAENVEFVAPRTVRYSGPDVPSALHLMR